MIKIEWPPNIDRIEIAFPHVFATRNDPNNPNRVKGLLFAYGEDIYNPAGKPMPHFILKHEYRHCARQFALGNPEQWWEMYITDPEFRYGEELIAHVEEYIAQASRTKDRNQRARLEQQTAARLVAPLYNYTPPRSLAQAVRDIHFLAH